MTEGDEKEEILHRTMAVATSTCIGTPRPHRHPCNPVRPARNKAGRRTAVDANQQGIHQEREVGMRCLGHASISMEVVATLQVREKRWPNVSGGCSNAPGQKDQTIT